MPQQDVYNTSPWFCCFFKRPALRRKWPIKGAHIGDRFDPNAYKLMKKFGYDFSKPPPLWNVIEVRPYRFNDTQKMTQRQG